MTKSKLLARLTSAVGLADYSVANLANARSAAEAALATAERLHRKAALDAVQQVPGAAQRLIEAAAALRFAEEKVRDVLAAQVELEAMNAERQRQERNAAEAREDATTQSELRTWEDKARKMQEACAAYVAAWNEYTPVHSRVLTARNANPRVRRDWGIECSADALISTEIARVGEPATLPPGREGYGYGRYDPRALKPLASIICDLGEMARADLAKAAAKRAAK